MIQILPCPGCSRQTVLPESASREATIQCPHCEQKYVVGEVLKHEFGSWIVVEDPAISAEENQPANPANAAAVNVGELNEAEIKLEPASIAPAQKKTDWSKFEPITHEQFERMRRKTRSPFWSVLQIVLGGVAAVPISLLLIWHFLGTDVGDAGPLVGKYVPWLVPEKFRPFEEPIPMPPEERSDHSTPLAGASGFRRFDDVMPSPDDSEPLPRTPTELSESTDPSLATGASNEPEMVVENSKPESVDTLSNQPENIFDLIRQTERDLGLWKTTLATDGAEMKNLAFRIYEDFVGLSDAIESIPEGNPVIRTVSDQMRPVGKIISSQPNVQSIVVQGAKYWSEKQDASGEYSLALILEIAAAEESDGAWRVESEQASPLQFLIPSELATHLEVSERLFLLGKVHKSADSAPNARTFTANYLYRL